MRDIVLAAERGYAWIRPWEKEDRIHLGLDASELLNYGIEQIEATIIHESIHCVLNKRVSVSASFGFDSVQKPFVKYNQKHMAIEGTNVDRFGISGGVLKE